MKTMLDADHGKSHGGSLKRRHPAGRMLGYLRCASVALALRFPASNFSFPPPPLTPPESARSGGIRPKGEKANSLAFGVDIRTVQDLLGHADVSTTMIYLHVMKKPGAGGPSPLDIP